MRQPIDWNSYPKTIRVFNELIVDVLHSDRTCDYPCCDAKAHFLVTLPDVDALRLCPKHYILLGVEIQKTLPSYRSCEEDGRLTLVESGHLTLSSESVTVDLPQSWWVRFKNFFKRI